MGAPRGGRQLLLELLPPLLGCPWRAPGSCLHRGQGEPGGDLPLHGDLPPAAPALPPAARQAWLHLHLALRICLFD